MSEKELRLDGWLEHEAGCMKRYREERECSCGLDAALAEEPDVVKVLRAIDALRKTDGCSCPLTLKYLTEQTQKAFKVRLTDDGGWEYVDAG